MLVSGLTRKNFMRRSVDILIPPEGSWTSNLRFAVVLSLHHDAGAWGTGVFPSTIAAVSSKQSRCGRARGPRYSPIGDFPESPFLARRHPPPVPDGSHISKWQKSDISIWWTQPANFQHPPMASDVRA